MKKRKLNLTFPLTVTFVLMVLVVVYTSALFYRISVSNVYEVGQDKISGLAASLGNYLDTTKSVLWVTADSVDYMVRNGASDDIIQDFLVVETQRHKSQFDANYTGLYGYIGNKYYDGLGWIPPEDYVPTERDWYKLTAKEEGLVIVPPYVDAQTGSVVISVCKRLSDPHNVVALDVITTHIQNVIESTGINGKGYSLIVDKNGTVIAHSDPSQNGSDFHTFSGGTEFMEKLTHSAETRFETQLLDKQCTVFADSIMNQWYVVIVVDNDDLFHDVYAQLAVNIITNMIVFLLIALFYSIAYRNEQKISRETEQLKIIEQQKEYEAEILRLEKAAADSANKAKGDFLAQMSHEIRTPINAVLGMNEMILRESKDPEILEYSGHIRSAGKNLLSIINSILDFSKIEDGKMEIVPVQYETAAFIDNLINTIERRAADKGLEFNADIDETLPAVMIGDDIRLTQIITNLLTNAVKYTERGSVTLIMKPAGREGNSIRLYVEVRDTGIGIREEDREKLFESFTRLDQMINHHIEGTGLGMSIVSALLTMMNSELHLESKYGEGSAFSFTVTQQIADDELLGNFNERFSAAQLQNEPEKLMQWQGADVLVTDDNVMNQKVATNLLRLFGIRPDLAFSGKETLELMEKKSYHILFLDHMMPDMDGMETLRNLRSAGLTEHTAVIVLTANAVSGARETYFSAGFDDYLSKPIELEQLETILKKYLPKELMRLPAPAETPNESEDDFAIEFVDENGCVSEFGDKAVDYVQNSEETTADSAPILQTLEDAGIRTAEGIAYCGNDPAFYLKMLREFLEEIGGRVTELEQTLTSGDLRNYAVYVHALKSAARTFGFPDIPAAAQELENAAKSGDAAFVSTHHAALIAAMQEKAKAAAKSLTAD